MKKNNWKIRFDKVFNLLTQDKGWTLEGAFTLLSSFIRQEKEKSFKEGYKEGAKKRIERLLEHLTTK